eukprot:4744647-Pleurochrysis_carterae.AAC.2
MGNPRDPIGCIRLAAMFYVVPVPTIMETMFYMGLRAGSAPYLSVEVGDHALCGAVDGLGRVVEVEAHRERRDQTVLDIVGHFRPGELQLLDKILV